MALLAVIPLLGAATPLLQTWNFSLDPDPGSAWRGPAQARGALVWAHGKAGDHDQRGLPLPPFVKLFNKAGFDILKFDRVPYADDTARAAGWLKDCLRLLRRQGYHRIIVAGQSRGGWNALQMIDTPELADAVLAFSPAAQGTGASLEQLAQLDELRRIVDRAPASKLRLAVIQFDGDWYSGDPEARVGIIGRLKDRLEAMLLLDRPAHFTGHAAGMSETFTDRYGTCIVQFAAQDDLANAAARKSAASSAPCQ
jgi:pimeloyl-ACP methyl ester carboxylesterase